MEKRYSNALTPLSYIIFSSDYISFKVFCNIWGSVTPSHNYFIISPHNLALLHSTLLHSYPVPLRRILSDGLIPLFVARAISFISQSLSSTFIENHISQVWPLHVFKCFWECLPDDAWWRTLIVPPSDQHGCHGTRDVTRIVVFELILSCLVETQFQADWQKVVWIEIFRQLGELQFCQVTIRTMAFKKIEKGHMIARDCKHGGSEDSGFGL